MANVLPYTETVQEKHGTGREYRIRTFSKNIDQRDLTWYRSDTRSRTIHILQGNGWKFLVEDRPAIEFKVGIDYFIGYSPEREDPGNKNYNTKNKFMRGRAAAQGEI